MNHIPDFCGDPIVVYDRDGRATYVNPAFERVFGWKVRELIGNRIDFVPGQAREDTRKAIADVIGGKAVLGMETVRKTRLRGVIHVRLSAVAIPGDDGRFNGMVVTLQDITDLALSRYEAFAANKAKSDFLSNISHEIRTPMNGLMGMIDLIRNTDLDDEQKECIEILQERASTLMSVLSDILDFSRIETGEMAISRIDFDLRATFETIALNIKEKAESKGLSFSATLQKDVPPLLIGDPEKLRQALSYLLENAVKFTEKGEVRFGACLIQQTKTHAALRFDVADTGIGIQKEEQESIFGAFSQADATTTRPYGGTGIGLTISKRLVQLMGGEIKVDSTPGKGTTFSMFLEFEKQAVLPHVIHSVPRTLKGKKLLIVDDDAATRMVVKDYSKAWGCICDEAANKKRAMDKIESSGRHPFDVVLIHMQLEKTEGEALAAQIRNTPDYSGLILILLYSVGKKGDAERLQSLGVQGYLPKPADAVLLFDGITMAMAMKQDGAQGIVTQHYLKENRKKQYPILLLEPGRVNRNLARNILTRSGYTVEDVENETQALAAFATGRFSIVLMGISADDPPPDKFINRIRALEKQKGFSKTALLMMAEFTGDTDTAAGGADQCISKPLVAEDLLTAVEKHTCPRQNHSAINGRNMEKNSIFNHGPALERAMDDKGFLEMVVHEFIHALPVKIQAIKADFEKNDLAGLVQKAHSLRGSAATIGADAVGAAARELEKAGDVGNMQAFLKKLERLENEFQVFVTHINAMDWSNL